MNINVSLNQPNLHIYLHTKITAFLFHTWSLRSVRILINNNKSFPPTDPYTQLNWLIHAYNKAAIIWQVARNIFIDTNVRKSSLKTRKRRVCHGTRRRSTSALQARQTYPQLLTGMSVSNYSIQLSPATDGYISTLSAPPLKDLPSRQQTTKQRGHVVKIRALEKLVLRAGFEATWSREICSDDSSIIVMCQTRGLRYY